MLSVVTAASLAISACSSLSKTSQPVSASYACGQLDIAVSGTDDSDLISIDYLDRRILLKPEISASGALYVAPGDDQTRSIAAADEALYAAKAAGRNRVRAAGRARPLAKAA